MANSINAKSSEYTSQNSPENQIVNEIFIKHFKAYSNSVDKKLKEQTIFRREGQLYHYTSLANFQKIIESKSFRATSIFMMEDPNELFFGYRQFLEKYLPTLNELISNDINNQNPEVFPAFVFSLTELHDDMHFWEKYGDKHKGIRIGFTPEHLLSYWSISNQITTVLLPVIYLDEEKNFSGSYKEDFLNFYNNFIQEINESEAKIINNTKEKTSLYFCTKLIASFVKRQEWSIEKEWRVMCIPNGHAHEAILGDLNNGTASVKLENLTEKTLNLFNNSIDGAPRDILRVGSKAGNVNNIRYAIQCLIRKQTQCNSFIENISMSSIIIRGVKGE